MIRTTHGPPFLTVLPFFFGAPILCTPHPSYFFFHNSAQCLKENTKTHFKVSLPNIKLFAMRTSSFLARQCGQLDHKMGVYKHIARNCEMEIS